MVLYIQPTPLHTRYSSQCVLPCGLTSIPSAGSCQDISHSAVDHGRWRLIYGTQNQYDAIMMLICDLGYYYRGRRVIRCQANSTWDYPDPRPACKSECDPRKPQNGIRFD